MEIDLVGEGLKFMALGMSVVFTFLFILVQVMKIQAKVINKFFPEKTVVASKSSKNTSEDAHHVAAIMAVVTEYRKNHKGNS